MSSKDCFSTGNEVRVENTNSESLLSKLSLVELGYRPDPFLRLFATPVGKRPIRSRRSPAINRGYLTRMVAVENSFEKLVLLNAKRGKPFQCLSLGAGYDTTYFRLRNCDIISGSECRYFEVDFPIVADTKCRKISENQILRSFFTKYEKFENLSCYKFDEGNFCLIGCNMTDTDSLENKLNKLGFDFDKLTIILTECSTTYVDVSLSLQLLRWLTLKTSNFVFVDYEQIRPFDHFGQIMKNHFSNRGSPLKCIDNYPTTCHHFDRFMSLGWTECRIQTIDQIVKTFLGVSERDRIRTIVDDPFDETEELQLKCSHYILIVGTKLNDENDCHQLYQIFGEQEAIVPYHSSIESFQLHEINDADVFERFGHTTVVSQGSIFLIGGCSKSKQRDNILVKVNNGGWNVEEKNIFPFERTLFCGTATTTNYAFIFGGRASPKEPSDKLFRLDLSDGVVTEIQASEISGQRPSARWKHTLTAVSQNQLILIGGKDSKKVFGDIYSFDVEGRKWKFLSKIDSGIHSHSAVLFKGKIVVSGGLDARGNIVKHFLCYNLNKRKRCEAVTCFVVPGFIARFSHTSHLINGDQLVIVGGTSNAQEPGIAIVDLSNKICREFSVDRVPLVAPLTLHTSHVVESDENSVRIVVFGGGTNCFSFGMHQNKFVIEMELKL